MLQFIMKQSAAHSNDGVSFGGPITTVTTISATTAAIGTTYDTSVMEPDAITNITNAH